MNSLIGHQELTIRRQRVDELSSEFLQRWDRLSARALEPNPFLHPSFVCEFARHLPSDNPPVIWSAERSDGELVLLSALRPVLASSQILFPHLNDKFSNYQFQGGMLLERSSGRRGLLEFLNHLKSTRFRHGLIFTSIVVDGPFSEQLYTAAALSGFQTQLQGGWTRACLDFQTWDRSRELLETCVSKSSRKSLRRARGKLERHGPVRFRVFESPSEIEGAMTRFLDLEARGWKREKGTAIGCDRQHREFFEAFVTTMAQSKSILFGELMAGDQVVASTCNLIAGSTLFAFKIGWDPAVKEGSPGAWTEIELANYVAQERPDITLLNSCSSEGSYLDRLWPHRLAMGNIVLSQSHRAVLYSGVRKTLKSAKRMLWSGGNDFRSFP